MAALIVILAACFIALFAAVLAPDATPDANTMIVELGAKEPGFRQSFLKVPKKIQEPVPPLWKRWFTGAPAPYLLLPVNGYHFHSDTLIVRHYIDEGIEDTLSFLLPSLIPGNIEPGLPAGHWLEQHGFTEKRFVLGTDKYGRDILSRLMFGTRVSLSVGLVSVLLSLSIGTLLGSLAGYYGGWVDAVVMWLINMLWAIPTLLLVFAITFTLGKGFWEIFIAIGLTMWVSAARLIRGQVMVLREMEYVMAAKASGIPDLRIIFRHILPNIAGPLLVIAAANFASAILIEAGLSFLGIGVQPPQPSWGLMIKEHYNFLLTGRASLAFIPGAAIMILVFAFNILGNALRDTLDVRSEK